MISHRPNERMNTLLRRIILVCRRRFFMLLDCCHNPSSLPYDPRFHYRKHLDTHSAEKIRNVESGELILSSFASPL